VSTVEPLPNVHRLSGEVDLATADGIAAMARVAVDRAAPRLVVDLTEVTFMDSQGLRALVLAQQALARAGAELVLTGLPPHVEALLEITGLQTTFGRA
jgi:anti-anti-sigma factor